MDCSQITFGVKERGKMPSPSSPLLNPMADFTSVPVVEVDRFNMDKHMEGMTKAVQQVTLYHADPKAHNIANKASFLAVDCELSGLGDRKKLNAPTIDERYKNTSLVAKTRWE